MSIAHNPTAASILLVKQTIASTAPTIAQAASAFRSSVFDRMSPQPGANGKRDIKIAPPKGRATKQRMRGLR